MDADQQVGVAWEMLIFCAQGRLWQLI